MRALSASYSTGSGFDHLAAPQAACAYADCLLLIADEGLYLDDIGTENPLGFHTDVLPCSALLLGLTLAGNTVSSYCTFSTYFTSTRHIWFLPSVYYSQCQKYCKDTK